MRMKYLGPLFGLAAGALGAVGCVGGDRESEDVASSSQALVAAPVYTELTLQNGWTSSVISRNPSVGLVSGIVSLKGAITTTGTNAVPFTLPAAFRPATNVYVAVDLCNAKTGRLFIQPSGVVTVQTQGAFSDAQCVTWLDGASFAQSAAGFTALTLQNGWTNAPFSTSNAAIETVGGVVHFKGAIATGGTNPMPFTLPVGFRPATNVYVPVDLCSATKGRLFIQPTGAVSVEAEGGTFSNAACFTSLDGAVFAQDTTSFTALSLMNGWTNAPFGTTTAGIEVVGGVAYFKGGIASGASSVPFILPVGLQPSMRLAIPIALCNATRGDLVIDNGGVVTIQAENGTFSNAQCFTSLDGASFTLSDFAPLALQNGWTTTPFGTAAPAVALISGIVRFRGAMQTGGTNPTAFTLPVEARPPTTVFVPVNLCSATKGRLTIDPSGVVNVSADGGVFSNAQCFTSLDGVSYPLSTASFTALTLQNGWTNAPFGTRNAAVTNIAGFIHLAGAVATGGTNPMITTLPAGFRPPTDTYLPVDLCGGAKGRLLVQASGAVTVSTDNGAPFSTAACFTSFEGVTFSTQGPVLFDGSLVNGWVDAPFSTRNAKFSNGISGIVRLAGAVASGTAATIFTLPGGHHPQATAYVSVDLCNGKKGRVRIDPNGSVSVEPGEGSFADAQCFTSLEGVWFSL